MVNFCLYKTLIFPIFTCVESDPHSEHGSGSTKLLNIRIQLGSGSQKELNTDPTLIRIPKVAEYGSYYTQLLNTDSTVVGIPALKGDLLPLQDVQALPVTVPHHQPCNTEKII